MSKDHYEQLGVAPDASAAEIQRAYRRKARRSHPDLGGSVEEFKQLRLAYEVLSDPQEREHYNNFGEGRPKRVAVESFLAKFAMEAFKQEGENPIRWICDRLDLAREKVKQEIAKIEADKLRLHKKLDEFLSSNKKTKNQEGLEFFTEFLRFGIRTACENCKQANERLDLIEQSLEFMNGLNRGKASGRACGCHPFGMRYTVTFTD